MHMGWIRDAIVCLFNAAIWESGYRGGIPLSDMPALGGWMAQGWPPPASMLAHEAVDAIIRDLSDRRGLKWEWWRIDADIRARIRDEWATIIDAYLERRN